MGEASRVPTLKTFRCLMYSAYLVMNRIDSTAGVTDFAFKYGEQQQSGKNTSREMISE